MAWSRSISWLADSRINATEGMAVPSVSELRGLPVDPILLGNPNLPDVRNMPEMPAVWQTDSSIGKQTEANDSAFNLSITE